jgi:hypothetical protein
VKDLVWRLTFFWGFFGDCVSFSSKEFSPFCSSFKPKSVCYWMKLIFFLG